MLTGLERVRLAVRDRAAGLRRYATLLGRPPAGAAPGSGSDAHFRLENVSLALEALPEGEEAAGPREGLAGLVFRSAPLRGIEEAVQARGFAPRRSVGAAGREAIALAPEATRGVALSVEAPAPDGGAEAPNGGPGVSPDAVRALDHVVIRTGDAEAAKQLYGEGLGLRLALDRPFPDWGVRLLFFRVGGLTVELAASLGGGDGEAPDRDRLWGLSWRVDDVDAARERIARAGLDVSPVRAGRKPGTRVASVRDGTCGVPTLLLGPEGGPRS